MQYLMISLISLSFFILPQAAQADWECKARCSLFLNNVYPPADTQFMMSVGGKVETALQGLLDQCLSERSYGITAASIDDPEKTTEEKQEMIDSMIEHRQAVVQLDYYNADEKKLVAFQPDTWSADNKELQQVFCLKR